MARSCLSQTVACFAVRMGTHVSDLWACWHKLVSDWALHAPPVGLLHTPTSLGSRRKGQRVSILFREQAYPTPSRASSSAFQPARQGRPEANSSAVSYYPSHPNPMQTLTNGLRPSLCYCCMQFMRTPRSPRSCSYLISPTRYVVATCCGLDHGHPTLELDTHPGLATHIQENRAACEDDESRVTCIPRAKMFTVSILTRLATGCNSFAAGGNCCTYSTRHGLHY